MELNHKRKTPKDSQEEPELVVYKRSLELEYEKRRKMECELITQIEEMENNRQTIQRNMGTEKRTNQQPGLQRHATTKA